MLHTIVVTKDGYTMRMTQDYDEEFDFGHYKGAVQNSDGDIVFTYETCSGPPRGKLNKAEVLEVLNYCLRNIKY